MIRITAFKWVPSFARGQVRDLRPRWALEEVGLPYEVRLLDYEDQQGAAYRAQQPFGQVPVLEMDGETIFETGAILLAIAERSGKLLGDGGEERRRILSWLFAALNSIEPFLMNLAEVDFFLRDDDDKARRRPIVVEALRKRLGELEAAFGGREYLVEDFSIADVTMSTVLRIIGHTDILDGYPKLAAFKARCEARPAFKRAIDGQLADIAAHSAEDMKLPTG
jgi:glutathione S-transferase